MNMKQIPYGIADYDRIIDEDYYFVDKTMYIPTLEQRGSYLLMLRPRRFGKSLFSSMLMSYYDMAKKDQFQTLFGNQWIGKHPTKLANTHVVLSLDFSQVGYTTYEELCQGFIKHVRKRVERFFYHYPNILDKSDQESILSETNAKHMIYSLYCSVHDKGYKFYLFIDEYDNFTNKVLAARGLDEHRKITHGEGFYRDFMQGCKGTFERIFMTGVTPVTYDDLTSGFGIADIIALKPQFHQMIGISEPELRNMIEYYRSEGAITRSTDEIVAEMKPYYDNYCFAQKSFQTEPTMYNTNMVMNYMREITAEDTTPEVMIDYSARTDYDKLDYLVLTEELSDREFRLETIHEICSKGFTTGDIAPQFPAAEAGAIYNFKSMLYYFGTLTYTGTDRYGENILRIPNKTMADLYMGYMLKIADTYGYTEVYNDRARLDQAIGLAAIDRNWQPMVDILGQMYHDYSSIRNAIKGEADIQGFFRGLLCLNKFYQIWPELELNKGYCDVLMVPHARRDCLTRHSYIVEIKYMKTDEKDIDRYVNQAKEQLAAYASEPHLKPLLKDTDLTLIHMVFQGQQVVAAGGTSSI